MTFWEYKVQAFKTEDLDLDRRSDFAHPSQVERWLQDLGAEGWELVAVSPLVTTVDGAIIGTERSIYVFKRPKSD